MIGRVLFTGPTLRTPGANRQTMDAEKENEYILNLKLSKLVGLYQILDPDTKKMFGYNVYHIVVVLFSLVLFGVATFFPISMYYLTNDVMAFTFNLGCSQNLGFCSYKMILILYYSNDIWKCVEVTGLGFIAYEKYDRNIFKNCREISWRITRVYVILCVLVTVVYILDPLVFNTAMVTIKNIDGSYSNYRNNVLNTYISLITDETYNDRYFYVFFSIDTITVISFVYCSMVFDIIMLVICCAISCHLGTISNAIGSLGHERSITTNTSMYKDIFFFLILNL